MTEDVQPSRAPVDGERLRQWMQPRAQVLTWCMFVLFGGLGVGTIDELFFSADPAQAVKATVQYVMSMGIFWLFAMAHSMDTSVRSAEAAGTELDIAQGQRNAIKFMVSTRARVLGVVTWLFMFPIGYWLLSRLPNSWVNQVALLIPIGFGLCCVECLYQWFVASRKN